MGHHPRATIVNLPQQSEIAPRLIGYVSISTLCQLLDASEATIRDWVKLGYLPQPKRIPSGTLRWKWAEIEKRLDGIGSSTADDDDPILRASRGG